jgi:hypothetical protein
LGWLLALTNAGGQETPALKLPLSEAPPKQVQLPLSGWAFEVAKLVQAGVQDSVTLTFVTNSAGTFNLGAEHIITLRDLGVSNELLQAMIAHDQEISSGARSVFESTAPMPSPVLPIVLVPSTDKVEVASSQVPGSATAPTPAPAVGEPASAEPAPAQSDSVEEAPVMAQPRLCCRKQVESGDVYRVREPNAVQLTAPILVWRGAGRVPNTMMLRMFP